MALADLLAKPNITPIFLVDVTAGRTHTHWTVHSGSVYKTSCDQVVDSLEEDGVALVHGSSSSLSAGQWWHDPQSDLLYLHCSGSVSPFGKSIQVQVKFFFSTEAKKITSTVAGESQVVYYDPRILSVPRLDLRIEPLFTGVGQVGGGALNLANNDSLFANLCGDLQWNAGQVSLRMGADDLDIEDYVEYQLVTEAGETITTEAGEALVMEVSNPVNLEMAIGSYVDIGTWNIERWNLRDQSFSLSLVEVKKKIDIKIPLESYQSSNYSLLDPDAEGEPMQRGYGVVYSAKPILVDSVAKRFKIANHPIKRFLALRMLVSEETSSGSGEYTDRWKTKSFTTSDLENGEFTFTDYPDDGAQLVVDFEGRLLESSEGSYNAADPLMTNAADMVKDLLKYLGVTDSEIDSASFITAKARLAIGESKYIEEEVTTNLGVYISDSDNAIDLISEINMAVGSYLYTDAVGKYYFGVWEPEASAGKSIFDDSDLFKIERIDDSREIYSKLQTSFRISEADDSRQFEELEDTSIQYLNRLNSAKILETDLLINDRGDAQYWNSRTLYMQGKAAISYKMVASWRAATLTVGDQIKLDYNRFGIDGMMEVLGIKHDLVKMQVILTLGDLRGFQDGGGFFSADSEAVWGSQSDKDAAAENYGFWCDDNGYATTSGPVGADQNRTVWI